MAHSHYVMDLFFPDDRKPDGLHREVMRIVADDDAAAVAEGARIDQWRQSSFYRIRAITNSARSGDKLIFSSEPAEAEASDAEK